MEYDHNKEEPHIHKYKTIDQVVEFFIRSNGGVSINDIIEHLIYHEINWVYSVIKFEPNTTSKYDLIIIQSINNSEIQRRSKITNGNWLRISNDILNIYKSRKATTC